MPIEGNLTRVKTENDNYLVFLTNESGEPFGKACYATPEGVLIERTKRGALSETNRAKKTWGEAYQEERVPEDEHQRFATLFSEEPQLHSFGPNVKEGPFAKLGAMLQDEQDSIH